jgi:hypothetical protein
MKESWWITWSSSRIFDMLKNISDKNYAWLLYIFDTWKNTDDRGVSGSACVSVAKKRPLEASRQTWIRVFATIRKCFQTFYLKPYFFILLQNVFSALSYACAELFSSITCSMTVLWKMFIPSYTTQLCKNQGSLCLWLWLTYQHQQNKCDLEKIRIQTS